MTTLTRKAPPPKQKKTGRTAPWWRGTRAAIAYAFLSPFLVVFGVFQVFPALFGAGLSFGKWKLDNSFVFTGIDNFTRLFQDPTFWNALRVMLVYSIIAIPLTVAIALSLAWLCNRSIRGISIYRTIFFLPVITSSVMSGIIWTWIFGIEGPINKALGAIGIPAIGWLQDEALVLPSLAIVAAWTNFGYDMLILLAGMLAIPKEYDEAAELDGAGPWTRFRHITLPLLKPALFFVLVLEVVRSFQVFDLIYVMTGGGPVNASYSLTFMIYDQGFKYFDFGYASAAGVVLLIITLLVSLLQRRLTGKVNT